MNRVLLSLFQLIKCLEPIPVKYFKYANIKDKLEINCNSNYMIRFMISDHYHKIS